MADALQELKERLGLITDLQHALGVLGWDQRTYMPPGGAAGRATAMASLSRLEHDYATSPELGRLLDELEPLAADEADESDDACLIRRVRYEYERDRKLPPEFVSEWSHARAIASQVWEEARRTSNFALFQPHLEKQFDLVKRLAEYHGYDENPYDALLDGYEPGLTTAVKCTGCGALSRGASSRASAV